MRKSEKVGNPSGKCGLTAHGKRKKSIPIQHFADETPPHKSIGGKPPITTTHVVARREVEQEIRKLYLGSLRMPSRFKDADTLHKISYYGIAGLKWLRSTADFSFLTLNHRKNESVRDTIKTIERKVRRADPEQMFCYLGVTLSAPHRHSHFILYGIVQGSKAYSTIADYCRERGGRQSIEKPWWHLYVGAVKYLRENTEESDAKIHRSNELQARAEQIFSDDRRDTELNKAKPSADLWQQFHRDSPLLVRNVRVLEANGLSKEVAVREVIAKWRNLRGFPVGMDNRVSSSDHKAA